MTCETTITKGYPDLNTSEQYMEALQEAAKYIKEGKEIPMDIIVSAIGKRPNYSDSPDLDAMMETYEAHTIYTKNINIFVERATNISRELK